MEMLLQKTNLTLKICMIYLKTQIRTDLFLCLFLGLLQYYLEENDHTLIKNATSELYHNLSYSTLSGARDFRFEEVSKLTAKLSFLLKRAAIRNNHLREIENEKLAQKNK